MNNSTFSAQHLFYIFTIFMCSIICNTSYAYAETSSASSEPIGLWLTENKRSVIKIDECPEGLCGTIHWITKGGMQYDKKNPDESKRDQPMCGLKLMWGFEKNGDHKWDNGFIYKADEGDLYKSNIQILPNGNMKVRGYIGVPLFGKSQEWKPVSAEKYPPCSTP